MGLNDTIESKSTSEIEVQFPTYDGNGTRFHYRLGYPKVTNVTTHTIDCDGPKGFTGITQQNMSCSFVEVGENSKDPVVVTVKGMGAKLIKDTDNTLRLVKFDNPSANDEYYYPRDTESIPPVATQWGTDAEKTKLLTHVITTIWS
jgi:hypothetical protein